MIGAGGTFIDVRLLNQLPGRYDNVQREVEISAALAISENTKKLFDRLDVS